MKATNETTVTVAILTHNRSAYLRQMLQSVLGQTDENFEIAVWDNASTDDTADMLREFQNSRITIHRHQVNIGVAENMNSAIRSCRTDYILLTHDDDRMKPEMIARYKAQLAKQAGVVLLCCNSDVIDQEGTVVYRASPEPDKERTTGGFARDYVAGLNYICCPTVMLDTQVVKDHGLKFRADVGPATDSYFWCELSYLPGTFHVLGESLYEYRVHKKQDSNIRGVDSLALLRIPLLKLLQKHDRPLAKQWKKVTWQRAYAMWWGRYRGETGHPLETLGNLWTQGWKRSGFGSVERLWALFLATRGELIVLLRDAKKRLFSKAGRGR